MGRETSWKTSAPKSEKGFNRGSEDREERTGRTPEGALESGWANEHGEEIRRRAWRPCQPPALRPGSLRAVSSYEMVLVLRSLTGRTSNITQGRAGHTTDKAALTILGDREFQGIAYGLAFITKVLLRSPLDKLGHHKGSEIFCSVSVRMGLYVSLQGPINTNTLSSENPKDLVLFKLKLPKLELASESLCPGWG